MSYFDVALDAINTATSILKRDNDMQQAMENEELQQQTEALLWKIKPVLTKDEFALACWHMGFSISHFDGAA